MPENGYVWECVRGTPMKIKSALIADAKVRGTNINDVATRALAEHFGYAYESPGGSRRRSDARARTTSKTLMLRLPHDLAERIKLEWAQTRPPARRDVVLQILAERYGLDYKAPEIRKRRKTAAKT